MDKIIARGLQFKGCHGVLPQEKLQAQPFKVDLELFMDLEKASREDDIGYTVDYARIYELVRDIVENKSFNLIEALAGDIAANILDKFPVQTVEITVYKPEAPLEGEFEYFAVRLRRERA
ncbi:dihydroneopterin aldolase [Syntrophomonas palmitatica]|uniref:dihydroneopterin aldolase n=1 Tax=Syntrophomonas palmitatica TaxID=402877 RepID=UPI0006D129ED|nr:dihydroneopterin aldolase [Syntrophomonas palmitatica]